MQNFSVISIRIFKTIFRRKLNERNFGLLYKYRHFQEPRNEKKYDKWIKHYSFEKARSTESFDSKVRKTFETVQPRGLLSELKQRIPCEKF